MSLCLASAERSEGTAGTTQGSRGRVKLSIGHKVRENMRERTQRKNTRETNRHRERDRDRERRGLNEEHMDA